MVIPSPERRDGTFKSRVGPLVGRVWAVLACTDPNGKQQTRLEGWTDLTGTSPVGRRHGGSIWNFEARSAALGSQGTPLGDHGGCLFPELSGRLV
ncbi:hypothetical protein CRG98_021717 [Punica granatum]|uniref:Uncharacterized protein n=1 Tax=Punica granatum TaxID=22663 RepID=A0A2I0JNL5_PUNGR|nr:hypothetical protein CRG98_021717 [Punica granatum]